MSVACKHPTKKMFWVSFSYSGTGTLNSIEGMMDSETYKALLGQHLVTELDEVQAEGTAIFQQDSAPCHVSKTRMKYFRDNNITFLDWPGNSPVLNPNENLWAICKDRLQKMDCTTKTKLVEAVIQVWFRDEAITNNCKKLVDSMPRRVQEVIKVKGGHIPY